MYEPPPSLLFDESPLPMFIGDQAGLMLRTNAAFRELLGHPDSELVGRSIESFRVHDEKPVDVSTLESSGDGEGPRLVVERRLTRSDGRVLSGRLVLRRFDDPTQGWVVLASFLDETDRREVERRLRYDAFHDRMTGLPNRALFLDRLGQALVRDEPGAVLVVGLDRMRALNEAFGHTVGDRVVVDVARRLGGAISRGDTLARIGGDEFAVLALGEWDSATLDLVHAASRPPAASDQPNAPVTASVGVRHLKGLEAPELVLSDALLALQRAKELGRNRVTVYEPTLRGRASRVADIARALRDAIGRGELEVDYQPIHRAHDGTLSGFEALVRWRRGSLGPVSPVEFVPVAEQRGLIQPLGEFVTREALAQLAAWRAAHPREADALTMSINLSPEQVRDAEHMLTLCELVSASEVPPERVKIEVTESLFVDLEGEAADGLFRLRALGVQLVLDDFGTGYSSLNQLASLRFDGLKADRSFVTQALRDGRARTLLRSIAQLARGLEMHSVAEGVETDEQRTLLIEAGFDDLQGFFFGRGRPAHEISLLIEPAR